MLFIKDDSWIIRKITATGVYLLIAAGWFLVVQLVRYLYEALSKKVYWKKRRKESEIEDEKRVMEYLWSFIDDVSPDDLKIIKRLMKSENRPIEYEGCWFFPDSILEDDTVMVSREINRNGKMIKQYMLRPDWYNNLMYSEQKYGRISHFKDE